MKDSKDQLTISKLIRTPNKTRSRKGILHSQLACSYECDLGGAMFWMCLEPGDFPAWAFRL
ncbi:MAG: hypothetical protein BRC54_13345, partial [Cyanobacteria bacterium SW_7_48_12]